jgi:hypothetical protein
MDLKIDYRTIEIVASDAKPAYAGFASLAAVLTADLFEVLIHLTRHIH